MSSKTDLNNNTEGNKVSIWSYLYKGPISVLALSASAYLAAFLYEASYFHYFGIDYRSVRLSIENLTYVGAVFLLFVALIMTLLVSMAKAAFNQEKTRKKKEIPRPLYIIISIFIEEMIVGTGLLVINQVSSSTGILTSENWSIKTLFIFFIPPLLTPLTFWFESKEDDQGNIEKRSMDGYVKHESEMTKIYLPTLVILILITLVPGFGESAAKSKNTYKFINSSNVVISENDNYLVVVEIKNNKPTGNYEYMKISDNHPLAFTTKTVALKQR